MCIGLNPSKAGQAKKNGEEKDDPTITTLINVLQKLGYGGLKMTNLYGFITSKPSELSACPDPVGDNNNWLSTTAYGVQEIIFCWGAFPQAYYRAKVVKLMFPDAKCFGRTKGGSPVHPLELMYNGKVKDPHLEKYLK